VSAATPRVSVVIPVWNGERTIAATLDSVLAQTVRDIEVLVIDDGSTDGTAAIVSKSADSRVALHRFENRGLAASRNRGMRLARGEFIAFVDADDLWRPERLARQLEALDAAPTAALAYSFTDCIDEGGTVVGPGSYIVAEGRVYERLLVWNFLDNGSSMIARRDALLASGGFDETLPAAEDWDLWLRIAWHHEFACVPHADVLYRLSPGAMSSRIGRQESACELVFARALDRIAPGPQRDRLGREGRGNLARYFTGRALTAEAPRLALSYWWRFLRQTPRRWHDAPVLGRFLGRIAIVALLPGPLARRISATLRRIAGPERRPRH